MAIVHDWHMPEQSVGAPWGPAARLSLEPLMRAEQDGSLHLRFIDRAGKVLSVAFTAEETDRLAEFLWNRK